MNTRYIRDCQKQLTKRWSFVPVRWHLSHAVSSPCAAGGGAAENGVRWAVMKAHSAADVG